MQFNKYNTLFKVHYNDLGKKLLTLTVAQSYALLTTVIAYWNKYIDQMQNFEEVFGYL